MPAHRNDRNACIACRMLVMNGKCDEPGIGRWHPRVRGARRLDACNKAVNNRVTHPAAILLLVFSLLVLPGVAGAAGDNLLLQLQPDGRYRVWHSEGATQISEDDALAVAASAKPEGGEPQPTAGGRARAFQSEQGVIIEMMDATTDRHLLVDRDACGAIRVWHAEGPARLTEAQMTELVLSALPGGGPRLTFDDRYAKAYITPLGYAVLLWRIPAR